MSHVEQLDSLGSHTKTALSKVIHDSCIKSATLFEHANHANFTIISTSNKKGSQVHVSQQYNHN